MTLQVDNDAAAGTVLIAEALLRDAGNVLASKRSRTITRIAVGSPIALSAVVHADPVRPGEVLETELTVSNNGAGSINGAQIHVWVPGGTDAFFAALSNGAMCSATTLQCAPREIARWNVPAIPPGGAATINLPPIVNTATADGTLLRLHARVADLGQTSRDAVLSRTFVVDSETPFDLSVNESRDPLIPGQTVTMPPVIRSNIAPGSVVRFLGRFQQNISTPPIIATDAVTVTTP